MKRKNKLKRRIKKKLYTPSFGPSLGTTKDFTFDLTGEYFERAGDIIGMNIYHLSRKKARKENEFLKVHKFIESNIDKTFPTKTKILKLPRNGSLNNKGYLNLSVEKLKKKLKRVVN